MCTAYVELWKNIVETLQVVDAQAGRVSLFDVKLWKVVVVQDRKELFPTKSKHVLVPFESKHAVSQGLGVYPS